MLEAVLNSVREAVQSPGNIASRGLAHVAMEVTRLKYLHDSGKITRGEFDELKKMLFFLAVFSMRELERMGLPRDIGPTVDQTEIGKGW